MNMKPMFDFLKTELPPQAEEQFATYCENLLETNKVMNLTAINDPDEVFVRHFYDSIAIMQFVSFQNKSVIDVGCGAGFPGLPLKLANPSISLTLLDSLDKRIRFLSDLCAELNLSDVSCIHGRAEEFSKTDARESFDFAVSRAVAALPMLCELCLPFVKVGLFPIGDLFLPGQQQKALCGHQFLQHKALRRGGKLSALRRLRLHSLPHALRLVPIKLLHIHRFLSF